MTSQHVLMTRTGIVLIPHSRSEATALLKSLGSSPHLLRHVELVGEAADLLLDGLRKNRRIMSK
jgi:hypothetical protein